MYNLIKSLVPKGVKDSLKRYRSVFFIFRDYQRDFLRYVRHSASLASTDREKTESYLIKEYHAIEKGLALSKPRKGFGVPRIQAMLEVLDAYEQRYGEDDTVRITYDTLKEYFDFNSDCLEPSFLLLAKTAKDRVTQRGATHQLGGSKVVSRESILKWIGGDFNAFFKSRYSVRDFADTTVDRQQLLDAIDVARFTPSACNRQAWRVILVDESNRELMDKYLDVQNGNAGFRQQIKSLLIIVGKISSFYDYERNQVFVDGGMFSMSVLLALHAQGLATCCLNMSVNTQRYDAFRAISTLDESHVPIMYIAVGHMKDQFRVARSERKQLSEVLLPS